MAVSASTGHMCTNYNAAHLHYKCLFSRLNQNVVYICDRQTVQTNLHNVAQIVMYRAIPGSVNCKTKEEKKIEVNKSLVFIFSNQDFMGSVITWGLPGV